METEWHTDPDAFWKFYKLLTKDRLDYQPFFFPLVRGGKDPWERISWKNNRKTPKEAFYLLKRGFNIGIAARKEDLLVIVDVDDMSQVPEIKETLQVKSRKRIGTHNYFFAKDQSAKRNIATGDAGEVRACWQYVVAPGSFVECKPETIEKMPEEERSLAGKYTLNKEMSVSTITFDEFPEVYKKRAAEIEKDKVIAAIAHIRKPVLHTANGFKSALWDLTISDVSGLGDTGGRRVPIPSEIHGSDTGKNCSVTDGLLHCWRHEVCHNAFSYLAVLAGILQCERAGLEHNGSYFGADASDGETVFKVWLYAKEKGLISKDDPIPARALKYYASARGVCKKDKAINNEKLSRVEYAIILAVAKQEGINLGRP